MRIVHVGPAKLSATHRFGGACERRVAEMSKAQARKGHAVEVYAAGEKAETREADGVLLRLVECKRGGALRDLEFLYRVGKDLERASPSPDAIHFHGHAEGAFFCRNVDARKVLQYDFFYFRRTRKRPHYLLYRHFLRMFDALLPVSAYCLEESKKFWSLDPRRVRILHNGVNLEQFRPDPTSGAVEKARIAPGKRVILYVGRVCQQKGTDVLLEAFAGLSSRRKDAHLVVAGPIAQFGSHADPDGWRGRIEAVSGTYLGAVEEDRLAAIYNMADLFVMPTREFEMFCMAAVEAQACGKPVVASDHGGLMEVVPEECGIRFPVGDAKSLERHLEDLLERPERAAELGRRAVVNASRYSWERVCAQAEEIYRTASP